MKTLEHTPGPWEAEGWSGTWQINSVPASEAGPWSVIAVLEDREDRASRKVGSREAEANAALIASAPALLAERDRLRALLTKVRALSDGGVPIDGETERLRQIRDLVVDFDAP